MTCYAVLAGGGRGKRMNLPASKSKLFIQLGKHPVIFYGLKTLQESTLVTHIVISISKEDKPMLEELLSQHRFSKVCRIVIGGKRRQDSVYHALKELPQPFEDKDVVLVHDAARPLITIVDVNTIVKLARKYSAVVSYVESKDTIKTIKGCFFQNTLERENHVHAQTPQAFLGTLIFNAYEKGMDNNLSVTDDSSMVEAIYPNQRIFGFYIGYRNLKITTFEDVKMARSLLS